MSIVFDLAEAINLLYGVILGEATPSIINKLRERATQKQIKDKLLLIVGNDRNLPDKVKEDLSILIKDSQFITTFLKLAVEMNSGSSDGPSIPSDGPVRENFEQRWESITSRLDKTIKTKVYENFRKVAIEAVIKTLSPADQHMHYMLSYLQIRMDQLQQTVQQDVAQQDVAQQAAIDELRSVINDIHEGIAGRRLGSLSVDDRVNQYFSLRDSLIPAVFMGRENEIDQINKFILEDNENCDQWWWWQADAWAGKTALMAHLASNPKPDVNVASVFIIGREPANADSDAFYSYLIPQLAKIAGLTWVEIPSDLQGRIAQLKNLIDAAAARSRPNNGRLVILVDGLDEDRGPYRETTKQSIAASLPNSLPTNVRVIVSSRHNPPLPIDVSDSHPLQDARYRHPLEMSEYAKAARKAATDELKRIIKITDGSNRYGRDMLAFMAASGGWLTARDLAKLTKQDIYSIEEILEENATARSFRINHLSDENLAYAIGHDLLDQLLVCEYLDEQIRPPLDQGNDDEIKEDRARYENDRYIALQPWRQKIAEWAEEYNELDWPSSTPDYLCSEDFADLLSRDPDLEKQALSILTNRSRIYLLRDKNGNDFHSITQLQSFIYILAERITTIPSDSLTHLATSLHFLNRLSKRIRNIPYELPAVFTLIGRSKYAEMLAFSIIKPQARVNVLSRLVAAHLQCDNTAKATDIAKLALKAAKVISEPYNKARALACVATAYARLNNTNEAVKIAKLAHELANSIANPDKRAKAILDIVSALALSDNTTEAIKIANNFTHSYYNVHALTIIAISLSKSNKTAEATNTIKIAYDITNTIIDPYEKSRAYAMIAIAFSKSGKTSDVFKISKLAYDSVNAIADLNKKSRALADVASAFVLSGNIAEATKIANSILNPSVKTRTLVDITILLAKSGKINEAIKISNTINEPYGKAQTITEIARALIQLNNIPEAIKNAELALRTANITNNPYEKALTFANITTALSKTDNIDKAIKVANAITEPDLKAQALANIAVSQAKSGNTVEAMKLAEFSFNIVNAIIDQHKRDRAWVILASTLTQVIKTDDVVNIGKLLLRVTNAITDSEKKSKAITDFATMLAQSGNTNEAIKIASIITNSDKKANVLADVAIAYAKSGNLAESYKITKNLTVTFAKSRALANIAIVLAQSGNIAKAIKTAELSRDIANNINVPSIKDHALANIATAFAQSGNIVEATDIANTIINLNKRAKALVDIAFALAQSGNTAKAIEIANTITHPSYKAQVLADVVNSLAKLGKSDESIKITNSITHPYYKAQAYTHVVTTLIKSSKTIEAIEIAQLALTKANAIPDLVFRAKILGKLAISFPKPELNEVCTKTTVEMLLAAKNPWKQYDVLLKVAEPTALAILPLLLEEAED